MFLVLEHLHLIEEGGVVGFYYTLLLVNLRVATMQDHLFDPCHTLGRIARWNRKVVK